jgi:hypothetical protein
MIEECDLSQEKKLYYEVRAALVIKNLQRRNMNGLYVLHREEALRAVLEMIPPGSVVGRGDSVTLFEMGIIPALVERGQNKLINPFEKDEKGYFPDTPRRRELQRKALLTDVFLTSTNAITLDGKLVNIDGAGNRVAAMVFGPKKVIVVAGMNKVVKDAEEGLDRIHSLCTPMTAIRHRLKHGSDGCDDVPCAKTGRCADCHHEWRACSYTVIIEGAMPPEKGRINVVLVGEQMGI